MDIQDLGAQPQISMSETNMSSSQSTGQLITCRALTDGPTFHLFSKLPMELQLKIWKSAIPVPQIITMQVREAKTSKPSDFDEIREYTASEHTSLKFRVYGQPSSLLRACHGSRAVLMKTHNASICLRGDQKVFFDSDHDTLSLSEHEKRLLILLNTIPNLTAGPSLRDRFAGVKRLAIDFDLFLSCYLRTTLHIIFPSLETLLFVLTSKNSDRYPPKRDDLRYETLEQQAAHATSVGMWHEVDENHQQWSKLFKIILRRCKDRAGTDMKLPTVKLQYLVPKVTED